MMPARSASRTSSAREPARIFSMTRASVHSDIIHDTHQGLRRSAHRPSWVMGSVKEKVAPPPGLL